MENLFLEAVKLVNPLQIALIGLIMFYFYNRQKDEFNQKLDKLDAKVDRIQSDFNNKFDKMNDLIIDLYKTLFKKDAA